MKVKWTAKLKKRFGYSQAKDCYVVEEKCFDRGCFRPHDWNHDGHLVCWLNASNGCPPDCTISEDEKCQNQHSKNNDCIGCARKVS